MSRFMRCPFPSSCKAPENFPKRTSIMLLILKFWPGRPCHNSESSSYPNSLSVTHIASGHCNPHVNSTFLYWSICLPEHFGCPPNPFGQMKSFHIHCFTFSWGVSKVSFPIIFLLLFAGLEEISVQADPSTLSETAGARMWKYSFGSSSPMWWLSRPRLLLFHTPYSSGSATFFHGGLFFPVILSATMLDCIRSLMIQDGNAQESKEEVTWDILWFPSKFVITHPQILWCRVLEPLQYAIPRFPG